MAKEKKFWDEEFETLPLEKLKRLQLERLQGLVTRAYEKTSFYRKKFDEADVKPSDITALEDIRKLPITEDDDTRGKPIADRLGIPEEEIKVFSSTSGTTTGIPEPLAFNKNDIDLFFDGEARGKWAIGVRPHDVVQIMTR